MQKMGSIPDPRRPHMPQSISPKATTIEPVLCSPGNCNFWILSTLEVMLCNKRSLRTALQLEENKNKNKALQQRRPNIAKNKLKKFFSLKEEFGGCMVPLSVSDQKWFVNSGTTVIKHASRYRSQLCKNEVKCFNCYVSLKENQCFLSSSYE